MKFGTSFLLVAASVCMVWLSGCVSPASRIRDNPEVFARLSPEQQSLVKAGVVGVGFTEEVVKLAVGEPDRVTLVTDARGQFQVWHYVSYESSDGLLLYSGFYHRNYWGYGGYPYIDDYPHRHPHDFIKVTFGVDRKVISVEQDVP